MRRGIPFVVIVAMSIPLILGAGGGDERSGLVVEDNVPPRPWESMPDPAGPDPEFSKAYFDFSSKVQDLIGGRFAAVWLEQSGTSAEAIVAVAKPTVEDATNVNEIAQTVKLGIPARVKDVPLAYTLLLSYWETLDSALNTGAVAAGTGVGLEIRPDLGAIVAMIPNDSLHINTAAALSALVPDGVLLVDAYDPGDHGTALIS